VRIGDGAQPLTMSQPDPPEVNDDPVEVSDCDLLAEYQRSGDEPGDPDVDAILDEIIRRGLDI
jgi:hypothetical protein